MHSGYVPEVQKIAVLRANRLGDFIFVLPALEALRYAYPEAELVLLALPWHASFLRQRPGPVNRVVVVPPYAGVSIKPGEEEDKDELDRFFLAMRQERFDLAFQMHGGGHFSNPFLVRLRARETIGLKAQDAIALDRWIPYHYFQHEILRYLEVVSLAGATPRYLEPRLEVTEQDTVELECVLPEQERPLVVLHPGASDPRRCWPAEKFAQVGDALAADGMKVVVTGTKTEREIVERVVHAMRAESVNLCDRLSVGALTALLSRSSVVVSNDSGPLHLAHAVGTRTVGIFWCFNLVNGVPLSRLRHRPLVSWQLNCPICGCDNSYSRCFHTASFVSEIAVEEVIASARDLIAGYSSSLPMKYSSRFFKEEQIFS